jgi:hypothetical protein
VTRGRSLVWVSALTRASVSTLASGTVFALVFTTGTMAQGRGGEGRAAEGRGAGAQAATPRAAAPIDLTGQWVAVISEDWRWRMVTPPKGDIVSIPLNLAAQKVAEAWDPAKDEAGGEQCKAYGAPGLMRGPIRMRVSWQDDSTLKVETDYGTQTRLFQFGKTAATGPRSWQGHTTAEWNVRGGAGRGGRGGGSAGGGATRYGSLKAVTTNLRPGYLRKNGVPYSERAVFTEHWDIHTLPSGARYLVNTNVVEDPVYLQLPFQTAIHYTFERDTSKWAPTSCDARF